MIGNPVEVAKLLLAAQPRVEDLEREGGGDAEDEAGEDPGGDAERRLRRDRARSGGRPRSRPAASGPCPAQQTPRSSAICAALAATGSASCDVSRPGSCGRSGREAASVRFSTACLAKALASWAASSGSWLGGRDRDDLALRDGLGRDRSQERAGVAGVADLVGDALGDAGGRDQLRRRLTSRVGSEEAVIRPEALRAPGRRPG